MAIIAAGILLYVYWDDIKEKFLADWAAMWDGVKAACAAIWDGLKAAWAKITDLWNVVKEKFLAAGAAIWDGLKAVGHGIMTVLMAPINLLIAGVIKLLEIASHIPGIGGRFARAAEAVRAFQTSANEAVGSNNIMAPNASQVQTQQVNVGGNININGAPQGTTAERAPGSAPVNLNVMGPNR